MVDEMDDPTQPFAVPPGAPSDPERQQPPLPPRPQPPSSTGQQPATPPRTQPANPYQPSYWSAAAMPPLGPPYAAPAVPPPPTFPPAPPEDWPAAPPLLPAPPPQRPLTPGGGRRDPNDPRKGVLLIAAIGAAAIVIVGMLAWGQSNDDSDKRFLAGAPTSTTDPIATDSGSTGTDSSSSDSGGSNSASSSSSEPDLDTAVQDIQAFVERERGLKFKTDVNVQLANDDELAQMLDKEFSEEQAGLLESQEVLRAVGLIPPTFDLVQAERKLLNSSVLGFYDPETKQLVVRGTEVTPFVRETLAHELTHALDDQWFGLNRPQLDNADDETGFGFTALVEGDATRVEEAYLSSLSSSERADAAKEQQDLLLAHPEIFTLPQVLLDIMQEPYTDGPVLVKDVLDAGQREGLDAAFQQPPTTSEQVIDPTKFLDGEGALPVAPPAADGTVSNKGVLGAFMFEEILLGSLRTSDIDEAIAGWGGDSYVTWVDASGKTCLRDSFVGDTPDDTQQLAQALNQWAPDVNATVTAPAGQPGTVTVCS
jgi:hypothetical protein